jgi:threonine aldolase
VEIDPAKVETNIVIFDVPDPQGFVEQLAAEGVELSLLDSRVRAVTHLDVDRDGIERALRAAEKSLSAQM